LARPSNNGSSGETPLSSAAISDSRNFEVDDVHNHVCSAIFKSSQRILDVASWKGRLILADLTTLLYEPELGFFDALNRHSQNVQEALQLFQGGVLA